MKIISEGKFEGKLVKKDYMVAFDVKKLEYPIPQELQIQY